MKPVFTLSLLFFTLQAAHAESNNQTDKDMLKQYDVELIIFEDAHARYIDSESWPVPGSHGTDAKAKDAASMNLFENVRTTSGKQAFTDLKPQLLDKQYRSLKRSSEFEVLFRGAWRQAGLSENEAFSIDLEALKNTHDKRSKNTISGSIRLVLARYLHFYTELIYEREEGLMVSAKTSDVISDTDETEEGEENTQQGITQSIGNQPVIEDTVQMINQFPVKSHRKMRSKELHYLDHPLIGMLIQITPVEVKPVEPEPVKPDSVQAEPVKAGSNTIKEEKPVTAQ